MSIIDNLIYDRTDSDLEVAKNCIRDNTPLPNDNLRYAWDYRALNRTEEAMEYVNEIFKELGYFRNMEFKKDWFADEITPQQSERYVNNLKTLRNFLVMSSQTPDAPNTINGMSIERANDIEKIIYDIDVVLEALQNNLIYCGVCNLGQDRVWQQRFRRKPYTRVEYIESTGTQYIDTGIQPDGNTDIETKVEIMGSGTQRLFGVSLINKVYMIGQQSSGNRLIFNYYGTAANNTYRVVSSTAGYDTGSHIIKIQSKNLIVDNVSDGTPSTISNVSQTINAFLFGYNTGSGISAGYARVYYFKIYDKGVLVRDFIPVLNNNNIPCMLDKVENKFYYNQGTGDFIAGT